MRLITISLTNFEGFRKTKSWKSWKNKTRKML